MEKWKKFEFAKRNFIKYKNNFSGNLQYYNFNQNIDKTIGTMIIDVIGICNHCIVNYLRILMS